MPFVRCWWWALVAALLVSSAGCAGKSTSTGADDDDSAGAGASGGSAGTGGTTSTGGVNATGGSGGSTTPRGGNGNAGSGGTSTTQCAPKAKPGCPTGTFFMYVSEVNECKRVALTVCEEPDRPSFVNLTDCLDACPGSLPEQGACDTASDCVLASAGCCTCEPATEEDYVSINRLRRDTLGECGPIACNPCNEVAEAERSGQYLIPTCGSHSCGVGDIRSTRSTLCTQDSDCMLRDGADCCEGCDGAGLVAVSSYEWLEQGCQRQDGCDACAPDIPQTYRAGCNDEGRCEMRQIPF